MAEWEITMLADSYINTNSVRAGAEIAATRKLAIA